LGLLEDGAEIETWSLLMLSAVTTWSLVLTTTGVPVSSTRVEGCWDDSSSRVPCNSLCTGLSPLLFLLDDDVFFDLTLLLLLEDDDGLGADKGISESSC
jgi:hypothetical protein